MPVEIPVVSAVPTAENLSWRYRTKRRPPLCVSPWLLYVRTLRYLLGPVGVHSVVMPLCARLLPLVYQLSWVSVATEVHGPKF